MSKPSIGILHYSVAPVIGGVEAVINAHTHLLLQKDYPVSIIAGRGSQTALPSGVDFISIPLIDSQNKDILQVSSHLEVGVLPPQFEEITKAIANQLEDVLVQFDHLIVHNVLTKHFNIPLTAALYRLLENTKIHHLISWCHDITWTSPNSRSKVFPGYPWDLLRTYHPKITNVTVSNDRQKQLSGLYACPPEEIKVVYNGVDPLDVLGLSETSWSLIQKLKLFESDLVMIMPVRVTQAKNVELALKITAELKALGCQPKLILTGPPDPHDKDSMDYFNSLKSLRKNLGIDDHMHFIFESGPSPDQPYFIDMSVVGDLYRVCDLLLMPSHREGFGMPVLEAGLVGLPVYSTGFPAASEIGKGDISIFDENEDIHHLARRILSETRERPTYRLKKRVRNQLTWDAIFNQHIAPLFNQSRIK